MVVGARLACFERLFFGEQGSKGILGQLVGGRDQVSFEKIAYVGNLEVSKRLFLKRHDFLETRMFVVGEHVDDHQLRKRGKKLEGSSEGNH